MERNARSEPAYEETEVRVATNWTEEQQKVFERFSDPSLGNTVVDARAGTGKTTTICEGIKFAPERRGRSGVLFAAFNRRIAQELETRVPTGVKVKTVHGLGYAACARGLGSINVSDERGRELAEIVTESANMGRSSRERRALVNVVRMLASKGKLTLSTEKDELLDCIAQFDLDVPADVLPQDVVGMAQDAMGLAVSKSQKDKTVDYDDMLWLPYSLGWTPGASELVVVDECQDLSAAQLHLIKKCIRGRLLAVGDPAQAIYGFAGADIESMDRIARETNASRLGLLTTFRCPRKVVEIAQHYVPDYRPGPANAEGVVDSVAFADMKNHLKPGDFVLSRTNAGALKAAFECVRARLPVVVIGRDFGRGLRARFDSAIDAVGSESLGSVASYLRRWYADEKARLLSVYGEDRAAARIDRLTDEQLALEVLLEMGTTAYEVRRTLDQIFSDDSKTASVNCSTVHRAKGLEANNVFLLGGTFAPSDAVSERNLRYVAVTRSKERLVFVGSADKAGDDGTTAFSSAIPSSIRAEWAEKRRAQAAAEQPA